MTDTPGNNEKRIDPRSPVELKVEYRRLNTFFADFTKNISRGGTFIRTNKPLEKGTRFIFKLFVPTLEKPILLSGVVQWVIFPGEENQDEHPGMGIEFLYDDDDEKVRIEAIVEKLMIDSLGKYLYEKIIQRQTKDLP